MIDNCYETCVLPATVNLWTADGSSMSYMGKATIHLWLVDLKFLYSFVIHDKLPEADFLFGIDL